MSTDELQRLNGTSRSRSSSPWVRKPLQSANQDQPVPHHAPSKASYNSIQSDNLPKTGLDRHLTLFDLVSIGIGGTIGSGLFVLCGLVAHEYAGPSSSISWALSGLAACVSGCCYAEMASRIPAAGSAYAYAFVAMGEWPAFLAALCLSLEYVLAASAVARSWADKVMQYLSQYSESYPHSWIHSMLSEPGGTSLSPLAFVIAVVSTWLLLHGVKESKAVTNFITVAKCLVVMFMVGTALLDIRLENWVPFTPFGMAGVLRGSTATFFGYLGYDEVCCLAGEAQNPKRNLPIAILLTLVGVTLLYITAALALTGMQSYEDISNVSGFPAAFDGVGRPIAAHIAAWGELLTLPVVVPLTIIGQPRLQYALAQDGLLPNWFAEIDSNGNLFNGTLVSGVLMVVMATCVEFTNLNDMISAAVLMALNITDTSLILLWHDSSTAHQQPYLAEKFMLIYHIASLVACIALTHFMDTYLGNVVSVISPLIMLGAVILLVQRCPKAQVFGGRGGASNNSGGYFRTPFVPYWPCFGIFVNYYLIAQLELAGIGGFLLLLFVGSLYYFVFAAQHSVGNNGGWGVESTSNDEDITTADADNNDEITAADAFINDGDNTHDNKTARHRQRTLSF